MVNKTVSWKVNSSITIDETFDQTEAQFNFCFLFLIYCLGSG